MVLDETLNPAQRSTLAELGAGDTEARTDFAPDIAMSLRRRLDNALEEAAAGFDDDRPFTVTKRMLSGVHGCQVRHLHELRQPFEVSVPIVRGTVTHKALELAVHWPGPPLPLDLVDEAIRRVAGTDHWASEFLDTATPADHAELRSSAADMVGKFLESWPPLVPAMRPATEAKMWAELCGGRIVLKGQADLTLGQPIGSGGRARKIIVDYKTGGRSVDHRSDLRFYALVETLRLGVPPRLLVTAYLSSATLETETVTAELLDSAAARVIDGTQAALALAAGTVEPERRASSACRWCPLLDDCDVGQAFLDDDR